MIVNSLSVQLISSAIVVGWSSIYGLESSAAQPDRVSRLFVVNRDGSKLQPIVDAQLPGMNWNGSPTWSHDGTRIAFDATPHDGDWRNSHIAIYESSGEHQGQTTDLGIGNVPSWSPDDSQITFFLNHGTPSRARAGVWVMNADGTGREWLCKGWFPSWSPDGRFISCWRSFGRIHQFELFDVETGKRRDLSDFRLEGISQVAWSPDGRQLAIIAPQGRDTVIKRFVVDGPEIPPQLVWKPGPDDGLPPDAVPAQIAWSPRGEEMLVRFTPVVTANTPFYILSIDGSRPPRPVGLKASPGVYEDPNWSNGAQRIVFISDHVDD